MTSLTDLTSQDGGVTYNVTISGMAGGSSPASPSNNSGQQMDDLHLLKFVLNGVSSLAVVVMGVVGNTMAMVVLSRRTMRSSTNLFLTALAVADTLVLLASALLISLNEISEEFREKVFPYIVVYVYPVGLTAQTVTVWLTVSFTVERYIAVCHPLRAASMCSIPRARCVTLVILCVSVVYNVPRWLEYRVIEVKDDHNVTHIRPEKTPLARDSVYHRVYFGWLYFCVMCVIPMVCLTVLNATLINAVQKSKKERAVMNVRQSRENNVTVMLISVVMVFIVCQVPALIYNMAYSIDMHFIEHSLGWNVLSEVRNFLVTLNSAVNFILYCALGQKFRRTFMRTFCPCLVRKVLGQFQSLTFNRNRADSVKPSYRNCSNQTGNTNTNTCKNGYQYCGKDEADNTVFTMQELRPHDDFKRSSPRGSSGESGASGGSSRHESQGSRGSKGSRGSGASSRGSKGSRGSGASSRGSKGSRDSGASSRGSCGTQETTRLFTQSLHQSSKKHIKAAY